MTCTTPISRVYNGRMETTRKNRQTGTMITVYREVGLGWFTICENHGTATQHQNGAQAREWAAAPIVWCEGCQNASEDAQ